MSDPKKRWWSQCTLAGLLGFSLISGRRNRRGDNGGEQQQRAAEASESVALNVSTSHDAVEPSGVSSRDMSSDPNENAPLSFADQLKQITPKQWAVAAAVVVAVPVIAFVGTFVIYPYLQDLVEGQSPVDAVLAEYGVAEDTETQYLTIRRGDLVNSVAVNGALEYANRERLSFGTEGTVETINVEIGGFVAAGDVLMSLSEDAVVTAEQNLQNAAVALQEAEEQLDELVNPDEKAVSDARHAVLQAMQTLIESEEALAELVDPSDAAVADAELEVAQAAADLEDAREVLAELVEPPSLDIENAELDVAEARKVLADLKEEFAELTTAESVANRAAELAVSEAAKARDDATDIYEDAINIDTSDINQAELELAEARLALVDAQSDVADAEKGVLEARANLGDGITAKKLEIAEAEAAVAAAKLALTTAQDDLMEARKPYDEEEVDELREQIVEAKEDIRVADNLLKRLAIQSDAEFRVLKSDLYAARDVYQDVFFKWLGMDISGYEWEKSPDEIFADIGISLSDIMVQRPTEGGIWQRNSASGGWVADDPETPWDEAIVATWTEFFLTGLRFDCTETGSGISDECVNIEFEDAWDDLVVKTEAYETAVLGHSQQVDNTEDALDAARKSLEDLEEQLAEALVPTDDDTIADLFAKQEVAYYSHVDAQNALELLLVELDGLEPELEANLAQATQSLAVAKEALVVARDNLADKEQNLVDVKTGPSDVEIDVAWWRAQKAESDLKEALRTLEDLRNLESPDVAVAAQRVSAADADLQDKIATLRILKTGKDEEIAVATAEVSTAEAELNDKLVALRDLVSPDETVVGLAAQEVAVAKADLAVAEESLEELINPDQSTVALRRSEVATAREELTAAIEATEGAQIIAPFDGVVANIQVEEGQSANPNSAAIVIADHSIVEISGTVDEVDVLFLQVGDSASIELEALGDEALVGRISEIAAFGESDQGVVTYPVSIQTEQPSGTQLPEGLSAVAEVIIREETNQLLVPIQALFGSVNDPILLVSREDGTLEPRSVSLSISDDFWTVIEGGVSEGETILMTVVGADTSQFGGFGAVRAFAGGPSRGGGR